MKKGQEPGQLDKEAVGRITCRILQEEEPGGMLGAKKLSGRLAGMLICLLCLTGGLCSAFLSGFGIRYLVPVFWILLIVSVLFWIGFSRLPLEGVYRLLAILGNPDRRKPFPAAAAKGCDRRVYVCCKRGTHSVK